MVGGGIGVDCEMAEADDFDEAIFLGGIDMGDLTARICVSDGRARTL